MFLTGPSPDFTFLAFMARDSLLQPDGRYKASTICACLLSMPGSNEVSDGVSPLPSILVH